MPSNNMSDKLNSTTSTEAVAGDVTKDNNNLVVYCEFDEGRIADVSLELLTKGRVLADRLGVKLEALVIGDNLNGVEDQIFPYGADVVYKVEDPRLFPYTSNPHAAVLINLFREIKPQICLMGALALDATLAPVFRRVSTPALPPTAHRSKSATTPTLNQARNTRTFFFKSVLHSAATSWLRSSTPNVVLRWPPCARA